LTSPSGVRFARRPSLFPAFPGQEVLAVQFLGPGGESVLHCFVHDLYDGQRMRPEKLAAWQALRERYGDRDESRVDRGTLVARQCRSSSACALAHRCPRPITCLACQWPPNQPVVAERIGQAPLAQPV
jgi:hypothetical protein